jgi:hypothetical protein
MVGRNGQNDFFKQNKLNRCKEIEKVNDFTFDFIALLRMTEKPF